MHHFLRAGGGLLTWACLKMAAGMWPQAPPPLTRKSTPREGREAPHLRKGPWPRALPLQRGFARRRLEPKWHLSLFLSLSLSLSRSYSSSLSPSLSVTLSPLSLPPPPLLLPLPTPGGVIQGYALQLRAGSVVWSGQVGFGTTPIKSPISS